MFAATTGKYKTSASLLWLDGEATYAYCSSGTRMTWTPQPSPPTMQTVTGSILFENSATPFGGAGGNRGSGGVGGTVSAP
jgi:hypothetical protein